MMTKILAILLLCLIHSSLIFSSELGASNVSEFSTNYLQNLYTDTVHVTLSPLNWKSENWYMLTTIAGITGGLIMTDQSVYTWIQNNRNNTISSALNSITEIGSGYTILAGLGSSYLYSGYIKDEKLNRVSALAFESYIVSGIIVQGLKCTFQRINPNSGDPYKWAGPSLTLTNNSKSFPSGHATSIWAVATIFASEYAEDPYIPPISYSIAVSASIARIISQHHWPSDVFAGACLGYFTAKALLYLYSFDSQNKKWSIYPYFQEDNFSIKLSSNF